MRPFCLRCGVNESIPSHADMASSYGIIDKHLDTIGKSRSKIKPDGFCLPRAVFSGLKRKGLLQSYTTFKQL